MKIHKIKGRKAGHVLLMNFFLKHVSEGKMKETRRRGRRRKQILDNSKGKRRYCTLDKEALDRTVWRTVTGGG
jgi:hypothetical protein